MSFGTGIRQVDRGSVNLTDAGPVTDTLGTTLTDTAKALLIFSFSCDSTSAEGAVIPVRGVITNTTTLTFTRGKTGGTTTIEWQVIEYY